MPGIPKTFPPDSDAARATDLPAMQPSGGTALMCD